MGDSALITVVIPFHQPINAEKDMISTAIQRSYLPLLEAIERRSGARIALHFSGHLLDHLAKHHEDILYKLKGMISAGQVEILGGLFYGGVPELLPEIDICGQIEMMSEFWDSYLGFRPIGFWLPELTWYPGLIPLINDTNLTYGFASDAQLKVFGEHRGLGILEYGSQRLAVFALNSKLSSSLPRQDVDGWADNMIAQYGAKNGSTVPVWIRAESIGLEPGTHDWCFKEAWLDNWLDAISGGRSDLQAVLPFEAYQQTRPAVGFSLRPGCSPDIQAYGLDSDSIWWSAYYRSYRELETIYRRMLRASEKLRDAIAQMEEEELDEDWSDTLATAQRKIFSCQSHDVYWRGFKPGLSDPAVRSEVYQKIISAEKMMDSLVHEDDWIEVEEEDLDADLYDEVLVSNKSIAAWIVPAQGGCIRTLDDRETESNILDVGIRRKETFFDEMQSAPHIDEQSLTQLPARGEGLCRLSDNLPTAVDNTLRQGIYTRLFEESTSAQEFDSGSANDLIRVSKWENVSSEIEEQAENSYQLKLNYEDTLLGHNEGKFSVAKKITLPIDVPHLEIAYQSSLSGRSEILLATEIPIRLKSGINELSINDNPVKYETGEHYEVKTIRVAGKHNEVVTIYCSNPLDVWCQPIQTTIRSMEGYYKVEQGLVIMMVIRVENDRNDIITLKLGEDGSEN